MKRCLARHAKERDSAHYQWKCRKAGTGNNDAGGRREHGDCRRRFRSVVKLRGFGFSDLRGRGHSRLVQSHSPPFAIIAANEMTAALIDGRSEAVVEKLVPSSFITAERRDWDR